MVHQGGTTRITGLIKAYQLYLEQVAQQGAEPVLDFTRAWTLVRFFDADLLQLSSCTRCTGSFVAHAHDNKAGYVCVLCRPPSRAGKTRKASPAVAVAVPTSVGHAAAMPSTREPREPAALSASQWLATVMQGARA